MQSTEPTIVELAGQFALALDAANFEVAKGYLSDDCHYTTSDGVLQGPEAIMRSYRDSHARALGELDSISYESQIVGHSEEEVTIHFIDHIVKDEYSHTFRSHQRVHFNTNSQIDRITHEEIEDERERLNFFLTRLGAKAD